jgi:hypothetical protein
MNTYKSDYNEIEAIDALAFNATEAFNDPQETKFAIIVNGAYIEFPMTEDAYVGLQSLAKQIASKYAISVDSDGVVIENI